MQQFQLSTASLEKLPDESPRAYKFFQRYLREERNLQKLAEMVGVSEKTLRNYSARYDWRERAEDYDLTRDFEVREIVAYETTDVPLVNVTALKHVNRLCFESIVAYVEQWQQEPNKKKLPRLLFDIARWTTEKLENLHETSRQDQSLDLSEFTVEQLEILCLKSE